MAKKVNSEIVVPLRIILVGPPPGVDFGIQEGKGNDYKTIAVQRSKAANLTLECTINVKGHRSDGPPNFGGPILPPLLNADQSVRKTMDRFPNCTIKLTND